MSGPVQGLSLSDLYVIGGGTFTAVSAYLLNRRGQRNAEKQTEAAQILSQWEETLQQKNDLIADYRKRAEDARHDAERERALGEQWYEKVRAADARAERYRERGDRYREQLLDVAQVVRDETVRSAAIDGATEADVPQPPDPEP